MKLPLVSRVALSAGKFTSAASRAARRGRGQVVGGRVMLAVDPKLIRRLATHKKTTLVSATNGKSTTTRFLAEALRTFAPVAHNLTGANMGEGVVTALAEAPEAPFAALEVDEAHLPVVLNQTRPGAIILMNLSRDQLDRGAEVKRLASRWKSMLTAISWPLTVFANADDPLVAWSVMNHSQVVWVGCGQWWTEDSDLCPECLHSLVREQGTWHCPNCGLTRPTTTWETEGTTLKDPEGAVHGVRLALPGRVNIGNAVIATAAAQHWGVGIEAALAAMSTVSDVDGRYISSTAHGHHLRLLLGKNPASWTELIDMVSATDRGLVIALNARGADGRDPSWLWDVPFEGLAGQRVWVAGERRFDMAVRLEVAGLNVQAVVADPLDAVDLIEEKDVDIVANYTAFQDVRSRVVL